MLNVSDRLGIVSIHCNFHAEELATKVFNDSSCFYRPYTHFDLLATDRVPYVIGWFCNNRKTLEAQYTLIDCNPASRIIFQRPALIHWVGTDIMNAFAIRDAGEVRMFEKLSHGAIINLVQTEEHLAEMKEVMPHATYLVVPMPPYVIHDVTPFEEKKVVSVYMPTMRRDFFNFELILQAAAHFPEVKFEFYYYYDRFEGEIPVEGTVNCFYVPARDGDGMKEQVRRSRAFLRVPVHDGLSVQALEFACAGRSVIYNKHLPFVDEVKEFTVDELCKHLQAALSREEPWYEMADHYRKNYGHEAFRQRIEEALDLLPQGMETSRAIG